MMLPQSAAMNSQAKWICSVSLLILAISASRASAVVIDDFENADGGLWPLVTNSGTPLASNSQGGLAGVIGSMRDAQSEYTSGPASVAADVSGGNYSLLFDADTNGLGTLTYNGGSSLNADLSTETHIQIEIVQLNLVGTDPIAVELTDGGATMASVAVTPAGVGTLEIPLASFAGVDLSDIDQIKVTIDPDADVATNAISIDSIITIQQQEEPAVPEPSTLTLLSLGFLALIGRRRRVR